MSVVLLLLLLLLLMTFIGQKLRHAANAPMRYTPLIALMLQWCALHVRIAVERLALARLSFFLSQS